MQSERGGRMFPHSLPTSASKRLKSFAIACDSSNRRPSRSSAPPNSIRSSPGPQLGFPPAGPQSSAHARLAETEIFILRAGARRRARSSS